ncbi:reverse transcriptase domain-containing protein [Streptomyces sp. NPDC002596]
MNAVEVCRRRCWEYDWVIDLDIRKFFDSVRWDLVLKAVEAHTDARWVTLYVKRWLAVPLQLPDGSLLERDRGTPQGSSVSPVLANLFLHYAFDAWLAREFPAVVFERYADDAAVRCTTEYQARRVLYQARRVLAALHERMAQVGLELHADKTRIAYCKDSNRRGAFECTSFTFLGYTFQPRAARRKDGVRYTCFLLAASKDALKKMNAVVRSWRLDHRVSSTEAGLARMINPVVRGWMAYYGAFHRSALTLLLYRINTYLLRWIRNKYKKLRGWRKALDAMRAAAARQPRYFAHWSWVKPAVR